MNCSSTVVIWESPRQRYDEFKLFNLVEMSRVGLWAWPKSYLYHSGIWIIPSGTICVFVVIPGPSG